MTISTIRSLLTIGFIALCLVVFAAGSTYADGSGNLRLGYTMTDETGSYRVNQETFNTYEGFGLSINQLDYSLGNGIKLNADLSNMTLNNRRLTASISKGRLFQLKINNDQYRRIYNFEGTRFMRRRTTGGTLGLNLLHNLKLTAGYQSTQRNGSKDDGLVETNDLSLTDYEHSTINVGLNYFSRDYGNLKTQYRRLNYDNRIESLDSYDRTADELRADASVRIPKFDWLLLSGGLFHRSDEMTNDSSRIQTNMGWGGAKAKIKPGVTLDYRLKYSRTDQTSLNLETDNITNIISIGKSWQGRFGVKVGYENRVADDLVDRSESDGFLFSSWLNLSQRLYLKASVTTRDKNVVTGATLIGDEEVTRHKLSARYRYSDRGEFSVRWSSQIREHQPDLTVRIKNNDFNDTRAEYQSFTSATSFKLPEYGKARVSYTYNTGSFKNNSEQVGYEFDDHLIRWSVTPRAYNEFSISTDGTYYRSKQDQDIEKFRFGFRAEYRFLDDHLIGANYNVYNFDEFTVGANYYTGNIVELYLEKGLNF